MKLLVSDSELIATGYAPFTKVNHHRYNRDFILFSTQLSLYQSICIARISDYIAWVLSPIEIRFEFMQPGVINRQSSFLPWVFFCIVRDVNICVCMGGGGGCWSGYTSQKIHLLPLYCGADTKKMGISVWRTGYTIHGGRRSRSHRLTLSSFAC